MSAVSVRGLTVQVTATGRPIVDDVSIDLEPGSVLGVVGESGSGKSTLDLALLAYARAGARVTAGHVAIHGVDMLALRDAKLREARRTLVSYVPQDPGTALNPALTLRRQLEESVAPGQPTSRIAEVLDEVGLPSDDAFLARKPAALSGGQQQRVAIAMAIVSEPRLLVLDEPTTGLDVTTQLKVLDLVRRLTTSHRMAAIYISHDLGVIGHVAQSVAVMRDGKMVEQGPIDQVLRRPAHAYTRSLVAAVPSLEDRPAAREEAGEDRPVLDVRGLSCSYGDHRVIQDVSFSIGRGECLAVVGESGSGKSTLSRTIIGLQRADRGEIVFDGKALAPLARRRDREQRRRVQYIFQNPFASLHPRRTIGESVALPLQFFGSGDRSRGAVEEAVVTSLERVRLAPELKDRYPSELSGGQRQRVAIARALAARPDLLICDEVTSALDVSVQASVLELLEELREDGLSMLFVTHNLAVVAQIADRVAVLERGRIVEDRRTAAVLDDPQSAYTAQLLADTLDISAFRAGAGAS